MNNLLKNKHTVFGLLGDFWYRQLSDENPNGTALARALTHMLDASSAISSLSTTASKLSGSLTNYKNNITLRFNPANVYTLNINLQQRDSSGVYPSITVTKPVKYTLPRNSSLQVLDLDVNPEDYTASSNQVLGDVDTAAFILDIGDANLNYSFDDDSARPMYYVPIDKNILPVSIATKDKELTVGTSFITNSGYILFYDDPSIIFEDDIIFCRCALVTESHIMDYVYQVDNLYSSGHYVARYMRATHSPVALRLALAEIAGLPIIKEDSVLQAVYTDYDSTTYQFDTSVVAVPGYIEHDPLIVGDTYEAGTIIGEDYIKIYSAANVSTTPWYRTSDLNAEWSANGLDLSGLAPFTSIRLLDSVGTFSNNGGVSSPQHLLLSGLTGSSTASYWNFVKQSETHTAKYISSIPGVTAGSTANAIDFYFTNMLQYNALIIKLRTMELGSEIHSNVMSFIQRDLPINVTPIIIT